MVDLALIGMKHFFNLDAYIVTQFFLILVLLFVMSRRYVTSAIKQIGAELRRAKEELGKSFLQDHPTIRFHFVKK